jgi:hypothetical protein
MRWLDRHALQPWAGLFLGAAAWIVHHQGASIAIYWDCRLGGPMLTAGLGLVCGLVAIGGGTVSWRARRDAAGVGRNRAFAGTVGAACAAIFLLTILLQSLIGFIVPACFP